MWNSVDWFSISLHKKWSFLLMISSVNVTTSAGNCRCTMKESVWLRVCICVCRSVCMCSFHVFYYFPLELEGHGLYALNVKLTELILQIGCPSYHLTSWRKPVLFQCIKYVGRYQLCNYLIAVDCLHQLLDALTAPFQCSFDW